MADQDWDSVTRVGSKVRGPGSGGVDRERVVKGKSAINAAQRSGAIVGTEKKFTGANTKSGTDGQLLAKVDRTDDVVAPKTVGKVVGQAISKRRNEIVPKMTQKDLAQKVNSQATIIQSYENGSAVRDTALLTKIERVLKVKLTGKESEVGTPLVFQPKKKA
ncbi:multiprotein-bridging factor 1 [Cladophialophora chaetospira]|uniref:Multiprotein-bridging factor 1 n=1 Tax=Cladophialophora chaetospira TaxID=386627 RepID=A0AA39CCT0_9EURO|nr:multiprotein-bridging factor 1 [Cladophialophora chaetospira]